MQREEIIRILLNEYNTLRSEIIARIGHGFQIISFSIAAYAFLAGRAALDLRFWIGALLITLIGGLGIWFTIRDTVKAHDRISEIELDINQRAGEDLLLVWENLWGSGKRGIFGFAQPAPRKELQHRKSPERTKGGYPLAEPQN